MARALTIRRGFAWNLIGNILYNLGQWLLVLALAHLADPVVVGRFSLGLAITAPVFLTVGMNLRNSQATDAARRFHVRDYLGLRHVLNLASIVVSLAVGAALGLDRAGLLLLAAIGVAKSAEALSQTYYGYFQQHHRIDLLSRSMLARSVAGPTFFLLGYLAVDDVIAGALGLALGWALVQVLLDRPNANRLHMADTGTRIPSVYPLDPATLRRIARRSAPLGLDAGVSSLAINVPRYAVQVALGSALLGVFASLAYLAQTVSLVTASMQAVILPRLAQLHHEGRRQAFTRLLARLALFGIAITSTGVVAALVLGDWFLGLVYPAEYVDQRLFVALMVGAALTTLQRCLCKGVEAAQRFGSYLTVDIVTTVAVALAAVPMTLAWGVYGAAWSLSVGFAVGCVAAGVALAGVLRRMASPQGRPPRRR